MVTKTNTTSTSFPPNLALSGQEEVPYSRGNDPPGLDTTEVVTKEIPQTVNGGHTNPDRVRRVDLFYLLSFRYIIYPPSPCP